MSNYKRKKSRRNVRCTGCTPHRWYGNSVGRFKHKYEVKEPVGRVESAGHLEAEEDVDVPRPRCPRRWCLWGKFTGQPNPGLWWWHYGGKWEVHQRYRTRRAAEQAAESRRHNRWRAEWIWKVEEETD